MNSEAVKPSKETFDTSQFHQKLKKRNKEAFRLLYEHYKVPLYNIVYSMLKDKDKTADIIQDTFIKVIKKIHQLQDIGKLKHWIFRIAVNLTINLLNRDKRLAMAGDDLENITDKQTMKNFRFTSSDDPDEMRYLVLELVERLPVKQQIVFNLKYIEGFKENEIAEITDIPVGTVKSRLNIARNRLKQWLKEENDLQ
ncbi:MAG: RNA polymerase sigma factor [bacterium]|nr:RNA polymerase sigma factor [bacterium]